MKEYIERAVALDVVKRTSGDYVAAWSEIVHLPAADVAEVMHGRWVFDHMTGEWSYYSHCSDIRNFLQSAIEDVEKRHKYCLNCGARMGKEANHGN